MATNLLHSVCKTLSCGEYNHPAYCVAAVACHFVYNFLLELYISGMIFSHCLYFKTQLYRLSSCKPPVTLHNTPVKYILKICLAIIVLLHNFKKPYNNSYSLLLTKVSLLHDCTAQNHYLHLWKSFFPDHNEDLLIVNYLYKNINLKLWVTSTCYFHLSFLASAWTSATFTLAPLVPI
jgi:hypothetical protein